MIYWVTSSAGSSARLYKESINWDFFGFLADDIDIPTGVALFPHEIIPPPPQRYIRDKYSNLVGIDSFDVGGMVGLYVW